MPTARVRFPPDLETIHVFQLEDCIIQANLGENDRTMARMYLVDRIPQADIAVELGCSRTTVCKHLKKAIQKISVTNQRLYKKLG